MKLGESVDAVMKSIQIRIRTDELRLLKATIFKIMMPSIGSWQNSITDSGEKRVPFTRSFLPFLESSTRSSGFGGFSCSLLVFFSKK